MAISGADAAAGGAAADTKNSWPEVVGLSEEETQKIKEDVPHVDVQVLPADAFITMEYNTGRVRVFLKSNHKVVNSYE
ncbi:hypothetical protein ACP70R_019936 [Stipagrostis hirtigluma subsp. patula]